MTGLFVGWKETMDASRNAAAEWRSFWPLPLAAALGYSTSVIHVYSIGAYIGSLQQEFGWSRAQISAGITIASFGSGIFCVPVGMLVDRLGPRRIGLVGVLLMCAAFALLSTATGRQANWLVLWGILAIGNLFVQTTVWTSAVASRFAASRGLAFAITLSGASLAATIFPILATWLIGSHGWRTAFAAMGGIWAGLRSPVLYKLLMAGGLFAFTLIGILVHFVPILKDSGAAPLAAAATASLIGIFSIFGRLGTGLLLDRFPGHLVGAVAFLLPIIACVLLILDGARPFAQAAAAAFVGLTVGSEVDVIAYLAAKHFGLKNFGSLYGALVMALTLGTAFGPLAAGAVFDHYNSYVPFLLLTVILMAASAIALVSLGPPPPEASQPTVSPASLP